MKICLFGHPYAPIGMGEQLASFSQAMSEVYMDHKIFDIYGEKDRSCREWLSPKQTDEVNGHDVRIFHINGDEVQNVLTHLPNMDLNEGINIIVPAWELEYYPDVWRESINIFDEVWAISGYVKNMFSGWPRPVVRYVGQCAERENGLLYPKKYFGIKGSSLVFLAFYDQSSYFTRKNPSYFIDMYKELRKRHPYCKFQFVVKSKNFSEKSDLVVDEHDENIIYINKNLDYDEVTSLIDCCDVFVSLHRAEGFGRGPAEAVMREKVSIVTNYSGVEDYSEDISIKTVNFEMIPLKDGEYPHGLGQQWADPDIEQAIDIASKMITDHENGEFIKNYHDDPEAGHVVRSVASRLAVGNNILTNLAQIVS